MVMVVKCVGKAWHMQHSMGRIYDSSTPTGSLSARPHAAPSPCMRPDQLGTAFILVRTDMSGNIQASP